MRRLPPILVFVLLLGCIPVVAEAFTEVATNAGVDGVGQSGWLGAAWGDYDGDGNIDLYVANTDESNHLYHNDGNGSFSEVGATAGVNASEEVDRAGASWGDYDNDGDLDLFAAPGHLYRNEGSVGFSEARESAGIIVEEGSGIWGDYDSDGNLDLFVFNFGANRLYSNGGSGTFLEVGSRLGVDDTGNSTDASWGDYDNDGDLDLYVAVNGDNLLLRNDGGELFSAVGAEAGVDDDDIARGMTWGDYDNDGDLDIYVANFSSNRLYRNDGDDSFSDVAEDLGLDHSNGSYGVAWADYDNDGDLDLYVSNSFGANYLYRSEGVNLFAEIGEESGVDDGAQGRGVSWGDYDGDGDLDLFMTNVVSGPNRLYQNDGTTNQWLQVKLEGTISNRAGIGAQVVAVTGSLRQRRDVDGGSGFLSQASLAVEFGLGSVASVDSLIVTWPSGQVQTLMEVAANQVLEVAEPEIALPFQPILSFPANQATNQPIEFTLRWNASLGGADSYDLQVADNENFTDPLINQAGIVDTFLPVSGLAGSTTYYWRVRAVNVAGPSDWTGGRQFTTIEEIDEGQIIVDTTLDLADFGGDQGVRDLPGSDGAISLREAIMAANNTAGEQVISFNIPTTDTGFDGSVFTIQPADTLISLTDDGTTIDGSTQTAFSGDTNASGPEVVINGDLLAASNYAGLKIASGRNVIHSLVVNGFRDGFGIVMFGRDRVIEGNIITGCYIGTDPSGTASVPNEFGLMLLGDNVRDTRIGGATATERNVVSGNTVGMRITQSTSGNLVQGNYVGTSADGMAKLENGRGIDIWSAAQNNRIIDNLISGNSLGISLYSDAEGNWIQGNFMGTNAVFEAVLGNSIAAIDIDTNSNRNTIGGSVRDELNHIAGNAGAAIRIFNSSHNIIKLNTITANGGAGVVVFPVEDTELSVGNAILHNNIYNNGGLGIDLGSDGPTANDAGDVDTGVNNLMNYPVLRSAQSDEQETIVTGTLDTAEPQTATIEFFAPLNEGDPSGYGEGVIYLGDATAGASGEFTVSLQPMELGTLISATATDAEGNTSEFALNIVVESGEAGESSPTEIVVNTTLDLVDFDAPQQINDLPGNDGLVTLREALLAAVNTSGPEKIIFNIPTSDGGFDGSTFTIRPQTSPLPTFRGDAITIDGSSQTQFSGDTNQAGPEIVINGSEVLDKIGLFIESSGNIIHALVINGFDDGHGILVIGDQGEEGDIVGEGNVITGCFIGTDPTGTTAVPNDFGISLENTRNMRIGGKTTAERNIISGNLVGIFAFESSNNLVQDNFIGTDVSGMNPLGNTLGVILEGADGETENNRIIGNLISSNETGILLDASDNIVQGNLIGTNTDGDPVLGNVGSGIEIRANANNNVIGGSGEEGNFIGGQQEGAGIQVEGASGTRIQGNTITANFTAGVSLSTDDKGTPDTANTIIQNRIYGNGELGIDLGADGVSTNDAGDLDEGVNNLINFPVLIAATISENRLVVEGSIDTPNAESTFIELFANPVPTPGGDPSGYGEGADYLGLVTPEATGLFSANFAAVEVGTLISATATDAAGNTSEFAFNIVAESGLAVKTPELGAPEDGGVGLPTSVVLTWDSSARANTYNVQVDDDSAFTSPLITSTGLEQTSLPVDELQHQTTYYWRVQALGDTGASAWSEIWEFTTAAPVVPEPPLPPALAGPSDQEIVPIMSPTLNWNSVDGVTSYHLQVSTGTDFLDLSVDESAIEETSSALSELADNTIYFWRVKAVNEDGESDWSDVWQFTVAVPIPVPAMPLLVAPTDGSDGLEVELSISWEAVEGAESYDVQLGDSEDFSSPLIDASGLGEAMLLASGLEHSVEYYWRARGVNESGAGAWSEVWSFTTKMAPPAVPEPPPDEVVETPTPTPTLIWASVDEADSYRVQVSLEADFSTLIVDESGLEQASYTLAELENNTTYFWRVLAVNEGGESDWSTARSMVISVPDTTAPGPPIDLVVENLDADTWSASPTFTLSWTDPPDTAGIGRVHYKIGAAPDNAADANGSFDGSSPIQIDIGQEGELQIFIWLEDGTGNVDFNEREMVTVRYDASPPVLAEEIFAWPDAAQSAALNEGVWYAHSKPHFEWVEATDILSGVAGYAVSLSENAEDPVATEVVQVERQFTQADELAVDGIYHLRLRAVDQAGNSSEPITLFTYQFDASAPVLVFTPEETQALGRAFEVSVDLVDTAGADSVTLHFRQGGTSAFTDLAMVAGDDGQYTATIPGEQLTYQGLEYYLTARDVAGNSATSPTAGAESPHALQVTFQDFIAASEFPINVWRMVSVPVQPNNSSPFEILSTLGGYDINVWRLFRYIQGDYSEFTQEDIGGFEPGRALWLHTRNGGLTLRSGGGQSVALDQPYEIVLEPGWNDIATPFAFAVQWDDIMQQSGDPAGVAGPYAFDGGGWSFPQASDRMEPWEGYAVRNSNSNSVNLMIPVQQAAGGGKVVAKIADEWSIQVRAASGRSKDVHNYLGFRSAAQSDWDVFDLPEPPPAPGEHVSLYFPHRNWTTYPDVYTSDFRPRSRGEVWEFVVAGNTSETTAELAFIGLEGLPSHLQAQLFDLDGQIAVDLEADMSYALTLSQGERHFQLVVGDRDYLEESGENFRALPGGFVLQQSHPNPFNAETLITYQIPRRSRIQLKVYDLLGRKVAVLASGMRDPGYFSVRWDGRIRGGAEAASGVYFYVLETDALQLKRKMVLLR